MYFHDGLHLYRQLEKMSELNTRDPEQAEYSKVLAALMEKDFSSIPSQGELLLAHYSSDGLWDIASRSHIRRIGIRPFVRDKRGLEIDEQTIKERYHQNRRYVLFGINLRFLDISVYVPTAQTALVRLGQWKNMLSCMDACQAPSDIEDYQFFLRKIEEEDRRADRKIIVETKKLLKRFN